MQRLIYTSTAEPDTGTADVFDIIATSARKNPAREITGFLIHNRGRFLQLIEGPETSIDALMSDLERDPRHNTIRTLDRIAADERWFPDWRMKRLISFNTQPATEELRDILCHKDGGSAALALISDFIDN
ncbi:MAG: BLUF domain-containing protein [Pontixanthobacter sp.]